MTIVEHEPLSSLTSIAIGGPATCRYDISSSKEISQALSLAKEHHQQWAVMGSGQSVIVSDRGFDGAILHLMGQIQSAITPGQEYFAGDYLIGRGSLGGLALHDHTTVTAVQMIRWVNEQGVERQVYDQQEIQQLRHTVGILSAVTFAHQPTLPAALPSLPHPALRLFSPDSASTISSVGFAGQEFHGLRLWSTDPTIVLNLGGGTADNLVQLMSVVKMRARDTLGIQLRDVVSYLGF